MVSSSTCLSSFFCICIPDPFGVYVYVRCCGMDLLSSCLNSSLIVPVLFIQHFIFAPVFRDVIFIIHFQIYLRLVWASCFIPRVCLFMFRPLCVYGSFIFELLSGRVNLSSWFFIFHFFLTILACQFLQMNFTVTFLTPWQK